MRVILKLNIERPAAQGRAEPGARPMGKELDDMKSKRSWGTRALSLLLCALCLCFAAPALAANGAVAEEAAASGVLIYPEAFGCSRIYRNEEGYFVNHDTADYAALGKTEAFSLELWASEFTPSGEQARVTVTSEGYDFTDALPVLLIPVEDTYYVCPIDDYEAGEHELTAVVTAGYLGVNAEAPVYLYFEGIKLGVDNTVYATVEKVPSTQFDFGATIQVGEYFVRKQGGVLPVEVAIGMGDMDEDCTVYLIYDLEGAELMRLVAKDGSLIGVAKKEGPLVISLEYSFDAGCYVSAVTRRPMLEKERVVDVFETLGVSFTRSPDEARWVAEQETYSPRVGVRIRPRAAAENEGR